MSIKAINAVWEGGFPQGGSELNVLLAMADWCDDQGKNLYPSIRTVARKIRTSECQARRIIHGLIEGGWLEVVGNHNGGAKGQSRQYRLNLNKLTSTPSAGASPRIDATPSMDARDASHGCTLPLAPVLAKPLLTIKEPSVVQSASENEADIIDYLNLKANRRYPKTKSNLNLVVARLNDGASVADCKAVIDSKVRDWAADTKWSKYLRPKTIFNATNFSQYVGELGSSSTEGDQTWE